MRHFTAVLAAVVLPFVAFATCTPCRAQTADQLRQQLEEIQRKLETLQQRYQQTLDEARYSSIEAALQAQLEGFGEFVKSTSAYHKDAAKALDKEYIQTRYPNGFANGAPADYYTVRDAREAIGYAEAILAFCRSHLR